ncbi:hypothetical protein [uncultured Paraglaciecola sp.]|uniref:hypothetical protein n=1 Tax=uncultured Paraglaciecola sp. TaxID=1765024 RepID=UPI0025F2F803|nr:hypothetical protein [uncultured Paraglaciecola sp.]
MTIQVTPIDNKGKFAFQNIRFIKLFSSFFILFILGSVGLYLLRGVPQDEIPYPDTASYGDVLNGYSGRPIPYNEILLAYRSWFDFNVIIYNDLNNVLSDQEFDSLDFDAIQRTTGASRLIKNGHRYWVLDKIETYRKTPIKSIGGHEFLVPGHVSVSMWDVVSRKPYTVMTVERDTIYTYFSNKKVYRLIDSTGKVFTMQAASRAIAKDQTIDQLEQLGTRLVLPQGWQFRVDVLKEELVLASGGKTEIIQDEFQNTYQRNTAQ